jgi:hypothetical protein
MGMARELSGNKALVLMVKSTGTNLLVSLQAWYISSVQEFGKSVCFFNSLLLKQRETNKKTAGVFLGRLSAQVSCPRKRLKRTANSFCPALASW